MAGFFSCFTQYPNVGHKICMFDEEQKLTKIVLNLFKIRRKINELQNYCEKEIWKNHLKQEKNNKTLEWKIKVQEIRIII